MERSQRAGIAPTSIGLDTLLNQGSMTVTPSLANSPSLGLTADPLVPDSLGGAQDLASFGDLDASFINALFGIGDESGFTGPNEASDTDQNDPMGWMWESGNVPR